MTDGYYFVDVNTTTLEIVAIGVTAAANHSGDSGDDDIHRIFLPSQGQYNKLIAKIAPARLADLSVWS
jgi:hypothetical protein